MTRPTVAVVIPTRNRAARLRLALAGVRSQRRPPDEVVVVSDGSTDGTDDVAAGAGVTLLRTDGVGAAGARNAGWRATSSDVVAFLDDDCVPTPGWLAALTAGLDDPSVGIAQGATLPEGGVGPRARSIHVTSETGLYECCNIAYRRSALEDVGGFDESFTVRQGRPFGEDTDLAWRVRRRGWATRFAADAVVRHEVTPESLKDSLRAEWRRSGFVTLAARYPELRERLPRGRWFLRRQSPWAQLALIGLAVVPFSRRAAGVLAAPYLAWVVRSVRPADAPRQALRDLVCSAALAQASLRTRRVLL